MDEPVLARPTRRRFLAFLGLAAAGGAAAALAATELGKTAGPAQPAPSGAPGSTRREAALDTPPPSSCAPPRRAWPA